MSLRILVVDDHDVVRHGVRLILRRNPDWEICGEAENGIEAVEKARQLNPDLIILDVSMPGKDGLEVATELHAGGFASKVLVLTMHESKELAGAVKRVGAKGYVIKSHAARDLMKAIETIVDGGDFFTLDPTPAKSSQEPEAEKSVPEPESKKKPPFRIIFAPAFA
jgi:two-component system nitrate/nitrite response regulator NarL